MDWGPYHGANEARSRLGAYAHAVYGRPVGILWSCGPTHAWLQTPHYDAAGDGVAMLVRCDQAPTWPQIALHKLQSAEQAVGRAAVGMMHAAEYAPTIGPMVQSAEAIMAPVDRFLNRHPLVKDAIMVGVDFVGVVAGAVAAYTLVTVGGTVIVVAGLIATVVAGGACLALLAADTAHIWYVFLGDEVGKAKLESQPWYQWVQALAPILAIPDLLNGGRSVIRETTEASAQSAKVAARSTALQRTASARGREFRETIADADQSWAVLRPASEAARRSAANARRMAALAQRENRNMLAKRNALVGTAGTIWATRQYLHEPPKKTEAFTERVSEWWHGMTDDPHGEAERRVGAQPGAAARPGQAASLLAPGASVGQQQHIHIGTIVVKRPRR